MTAPVAIVEFTYMEESRESPLLPGHWAWRVCGKTRDPVVKCHVCGTEMRLTANYTIAPSDGLVGSVRGVPFVCLGAPDCRVVARFMLCDYTAHRKLVD